MDMEKGDAFDLSNFNLFNSSCICFYSRIVLEKGRLFQYPILTVAFKNIISFHGYSLQQVLKILMKDFRIYQTMNNGHDCLGGCL
jgi:hypothetical protein